jgi:hypothetical protein
MRYTVEDGGRLNNFAVEPKMYQAEPATPAQKRNLVMLGVATLVLVAGLVAVAAAVS